MDTEGAELGELREADPSELDWLAEHDGHMGIGYAPSGWPAETWVLHGMWEDPAAAAAGVEPRSVEPRSVEQRWRDEHPGQEGIGTLAYEPTPCSEPPPPGWRRLRWRELADRLGEPLDGEEYEGHPVPPCFQWFPIRSWPETIQTPPRAASTRSAPTGSCACSPSTLPVGLPRRVSASTTCSTARCA